MINAHASQIYISKMIQESHLERSYVLKTNLPEKVVIDCQSFIQGLRIGEFEEAYTYLLDSFECENLQKRIKTSLKKRRSHCIEVEEEIVQDYTCK